jgi:hypothetical protein
MSSAEAPVRLPPGLLRRATRPQPILIGSEPTGKQSEVPEWQPSLQGPLVSSQARPSRLPGTGQALPQAAPLAAPVIRPAVVDLHGPAIGETGCGKGLAEHGPVPSSPPAPEYRVVFGELIVESQFVSYQR